MASIGSQKQTTTASSFEVNSDFQETIEVLSEENDDLRKIAQQLTGQMVLLRGTLNEDV
jgi:ribosomal protein L1